MMIDKALDLGFGEPEETYSSSDHLYEELDIPRDVTGVLPRSKRTRAGLDAEKVEDLGETGKHAGGRSAGGRGAGGAVAAGAVPAVAVVARDSGGRSGGRDSGSRSGGHDTVTEEAPPRARAHRTASRATTYARCRPGSGRRPRVARRPRLRRRSEPSRPRPMHRHPGPARVARPRNAAAAAAAAAAPSPPPNSPAFAKMITVP